MSYEDIEKELQEFKPTLRNILEIIIGIGIGIFFCFAFGLYGD